MTRSLGAVGPKMQDVGASSRDNDTSQTMLNLGLVVEAFSNTLRAASDAWS